MDVGKVEFRNVCFSYPARAAVIDVRKGEKPPPASEKGEQVHSDTLFGGPMLLKLMMSKLGARQCVIHYSWRQDAGGSRTFRIGQDNLIKAAVSLLRPLVWLRACRRSGARIHC